MIRVANAPVSYGAFEITVGVLPNVPGPEEVLTAIAQAGYEGTELGPPGYLGDREHAARAARAARARPRRRATSRSGSASPSTGTRTSPRWS